KNMILRMRRLHTLNRVDRITPRLALLEPRRRKMRISGASQLHHPIAIRPQCALDALFMRRVPVGNHQHSIERKSPHGFASHGEVRVMDRVKRTAENRESQRHQGSRLIRMFRKYTFIAGPRWSCNASTPLNLLVSFNSAVTWPFTLSVMLSPLARIS